MYNFLKPYASLSFKSGIDGGGGTIIDCLFMTAGSNGGAYLIVSGALGAFWVVKLVWAMISFGGGGIFIAFFGGAGILDW